MTLIMGKVCSDGVVLASDSKAYGNDGQATYDNQKIFNLPGERAMAFSGRDIQTHTGRAIAGSIQTLLRYRSDISLDRLAETVYETCTWHLYTETTRIGVLLADSRRIYQIVAEKGYCLVEALEGGGIGCLGIDDVSLPELGRKFKDTIDDMDKFMREVLLHNEGDYVGGEPQVVIMRV